jgi:hypothetical protein
MLDNVRRKGCKMRKTWQKPKLVVLVRGRPEECVLAGCKTGGTATEVTAATNEVDCIENLVNCEICSETAST